ncbi:unnamed protein product, partial [Prunus brigantina]
MEVSKCCCGKQTQEFTSWTDVNLGRRFFGCAKHGRGQGCNFFQWIDDPKLPVDKTMNPPGSIDPRMCERSRTVITGLLRK